MLNQITCECGNKVDVPDEQANTHLRCPRCGRRMDIDAEYIHRFIDDEQPIVVGNDSQTDSQTQHTTAVPFIAQHRTGEDPEATLVYSVSPRNVSEGSKTDPALTAPVDDFEVNYSPVKNSADMQSADTSPSSSGSAHGVKYDLSQRVMRSISKPVLPVIPYTGANDYGIHRILRVHQRGGMGRILIAYDQYLKREVAIKELHLDIAEDDSIVRRFIGEAEITAQLEHPGVIPIYRLGLGNDGLPYYTMKMIKGETLQEAIKKYHRSPTLAELLNLIRRLVSVSKTIAFAHSKGVIHRDLKPANVMLGEYGETLVMDWGLAKPYNHGMEDSYVSIIHRTKQPRPELTMVGAIVGTPAFMSPEQARAEENAVGPLADVFGLGTVLYYLLAGQTAFSGRSTQEVLNKVRACNPIPPSHVKPNVPHGLEAICLKAMEKLPENRYQGASDFADDLCRWLDDEPIVAEKPTFWTKIRWWMMRHRTLTVQVPSVLILSVVLSCVGIWLIEQNRNNVKPDQQNQSNVTDTIEKEPTEDQKPTDQK